MARPLLYTFGNHVHWVGAQWSEGYEGLARSVRETLALVRQSGARGALGIDAVGLERLAIDAPDALIELRSALADGVLELVGGTYAQPCGLFHGGESNVRQRLLGARTLRRLAGVWPKCAWEASFDFFPQAPQLLAAAGFESAVLFHAWSARTPHMPLEREPHVVWEGLDGVRLPAAAHTAHCLQATVGELDAALAASADADELVFVQWLELLTSPESSGSAQRLAPRLAQLFADARFDARSLTPSQLVAELRRRFPSAPVRRYGLDETFHGAPIGKNGDYMLRFSRSAEEQLLAAESVASLAGMFGRPYASADVYPTWELDEAWRELGVGQHHEVHEREGMSGALGERAFERAVAMSSEVFQRTLEHLGGRVDALEGSSIVYNPLGWTRDVQHDHGVVRAVPAYGYKVVDPYDEIEEPRLGRIQMESTDDELVLRRGEFEARIDRRGGVVTQLTSRDFPQGALDKSRPLGRLEMKRNRSLERFDTVHLSAASSESADFAEYAFLREGRGGSRIRVVYSMSMLHDALWIRFQGENVARPDPGTAAALSLPVSPGFKPAKLLRDHPYGVSETRAERNFVRRWPDGEDGAPMLERVERPFTAQTFVDLLEGDESGRGLLLLNDGSQGFVREAQGVRSILNAYDPWDGEHFDNVFDAEFWIAPHGSLTNTERMRLSMECNLGSPRFESSASVLGGGDLPPTLGALNVDSPNVLATALYREGPHAFEHQPDSFGASVRDPFVIRLVEFDGKSSEALVRLPGAIARAAKTDLLGRVLAPLAPRAAPPPFGPAQLPWSALVVPMRPFEIATVMVDLEFGRGIPAPFRDTLEAAARARRRASL